MFDNILREYGLNCLVQYLESQKEDLVQGLLQPPSFHTPLIMEKFCPSMYSLLNWSENYSSVYAKKADNLTLKHYWECMLKYNRGKTLELIRDTDKPPPEFLFKNNTCFCQSGDYSWEHQNNSRYTMKRNKTPLQTIHQPYLCL